MQKAHDKGGQRNIIGKRIREARRAHKPAISQEDLAARLAVRGIYFDRSAISRMEDGRRFVRDFGDCGLTQSVDPVAFWAQVGLHFLGEYKKLAASLPRTCGTKYP